METYSITLDQKTINEIVKEYSSYLVKSNNPYLTYCIKLDDANINIYSSCKVVFQGKNSLYYYQKYKKDDNFYVHESRVRDIKFVVLCSGDLPGNYNFDIISKYMHKVAKNLNSEVVGEIYRCQARLFRWKHPVIEANVASYKENLMKAGQELVENGRISEEVSKSLRMPFVAYNAYYKTANKEADNFMSMYPELNNGGEYES